MHTDPWNELLQPLAGLVAGVASLWREGGWLLTLIERVDRERVRATVAALRREFPDATAAQLADTLTWRKAWLAGGVGLAGGLLPPGVNLPAIAVDLVATVALELELIHEIACASGYDLDHPDRQREALVVLAAGLGVGRLSEIGRPLAAEMAGAGLARLNLEPIVRWLGVELAERLLQRGVPLLVGAAVGAGVNLAALHLVGQAARQFYGKTGETFGH